VVKNEKGLSDFLICKNVFFWLVGVSDRNIGTGQEKTEEKREEANPSMR